MYFGWGHSALKNTINNKYLIWELNALLHLKLNSKVNYYTNVKSIFTNVILEYKDEYIINRVYTYLRIGNQKEKTQEFWPHHFIVFENFAPN